MNSRQSLATAVKRIFTAFCQYHSGLVYTGLYLCVCVCLFIYLFCLFGGVSASVCVWFFSSCRSGLLLLDKALDRETTDRYTLVVTASDGKADGVCHGCSPGKTWYPPTPTHAHPSLHPLKVSGKLIPSGFTVKKIDQTAGCCAFPQAQPSSPINSSNLSCITNDTEIDTPIAHIGHAVLQALVTCKNYHKSSFYSLVAYWAVKRMGCITVWSKTHVEAVSIVLGVKASDWLVSYLKWTGRSEDRPAGQTEVHCRSVCVRTTLNDPGT